MKRSFPAARVTPLFLAPLLLAGPVWRERSPMPVARAGCIAGPWRGQLLVAGGSYWETGVKHYSARTDLFDPANNRWTPGPPLPAARSDAAAAIGDGNSLYVFGGTVDGILTDTALVFNGKTWREDATRRLASPTAYAAAAVIGADMYLFGGLAKLGEISTAASTLHRFRRSWQPCPAFPGAARITAAVTAHQGRLYVFGGVSQTAGQAIENRRDAWSFDPAANRWNRLRDLPVARRAWSAVSSGDRILLLGGYTDTYSDEIYSFDPAGGTYEAAGNLPHAIADPRFVVLGRLLLNAGGESGDKIRAPWTWETTLP